MSRKTIAVQDVLDRANMMLQTQSTQHGRQAVYVLLESVLHATGNYKGFKYQSSEFNTPEEFARTGMVLREDYDDTRRYYY